MSVDKPINSEEIRCKHCDLPIRQTHMGHVRNEWEHMNGLSVCSNSSNWAWPINSVSPASTKEEK